LIVRGAGRLISVAESEVPMPYDEDSPFVRLLSTKYKRNLENEALVILETNRHTS
jgi:hypothetical protein